MNGKKVCAPYEHAANCVASPWLSKTALYNSASVAVVCVSAATTRTTTTEDAEPAAVPDSAGA